MAEGSHPLVNFVATAASNMKCALERPQVQLKRTINHRRFLQKQLLTSFSNKRQPKRRCLKRLTKRPGKEKYHETMGPLGFNESCSSMRNLNPALFEHQKQLYLTEDEKYKRSATSGKSYHTNVQYSECSLGPYNYESYEWREDGIGMIEEINCVASSSCASGNNNECHQQTALASDADNEAKANCASAWLKQPTAFTTTGHLSACLRQSPVQPNCAEHSDGPAVSQNNTAVRPCEYQDYNSPVGLTLSSFQSVIACPDATSCNYEVDAVESFLSDISNALSSTSCREPGSDVVATLPTAVCTGSANDHHDLPAMQLDGVNQSGQGEICVRESETHLAGEDTLLNELPPFSVFLPKGLS